jgi:hypothetical protein
MSVSPCAVVAVCGDYAGHFFQTQEQKWKKRPEKK